MCNFTFSFKPLLLCYLDNFDFLNLYCTINGKLCWYIKCVMFIVIHYAAALYFQLWRSFNRHSRRQHTINTMTMSMHRYVHRTLGLYKILKIAKSCYNRHSSHHYSVFVRSAKNLILWRSLLYGYSYNASCDDQSWVSECPGVKNYKWRLNPVWHRMLYDNSGRQSVRHHTCILSVVEPPRDDRSRLSFSHTVQLNLPVHSDQLIARHFGDCRRHCTRTKNESTCTASQPSGPHRFSTAATVVTQQTQWIPSTNNELQSLAKLIRVLS